MMGRKGRTLLGAGAGIVSLAGASVAFACSTLAPTANVLSGTTDGLPGTVVTVTATGLNTMHDSSTTVAVGPTTIVWADAQQHEITPLTQPIQAANSLTVNVTIPNSPPGFYYIEAYRGTFYATPVRFDINDPNAGKYTAPAPNYGSADGRQFGGLSSGNPGSTAGSGGAGSAVAPVGAAAAAAQQAANQSGPAANAPGAAGVSRNGSTIVAGRLSPSTSGAAQGVTAPGATTPAGAPKAPSSKVLGDLWGTFAHGQTTSQVPGLIESPSGSPAPLIAGLAMGAVAAMLGGFFVAEFARRRATSTVS